MASPRRNGAGEPFDLTEDRGLIDREPLHYRSLRKLGAGGMGEVYLALDTKLDREVALEVVPEAFAAAGRRLDDPPRRGL